MIRRNLGSTDLRISAIGMGVFAIGGWMWGAQEDCDSIAAIHAAIDAGVNWIDTAPIYGNGRADRIVAEAIRQLPAERRPMVFTKFGHHLVDGQRINDGSRARVIADCDYNLKAFGVDTLDLFQLHWPTSTPIAETAAACGELLKAGKIRAIGVCNFNLAQLVEWHATGVPLHALQCPYSLIRPEVAAAELPWCAEYGVGALAYSPLHRGMLSGTWTADKTFAKDDHRSERADFQGPRLARFLAAVEELRVIAEDDDLTVPQLAIGYLLCTEGLSGCIVGARNAAQGEALVDLGMPIKAKHMDAVDAVLAKLKADLG
jgi:aryl-alcohol dehydrogenase-like predicted oxidoreductase